VLGAVAVTAIVHATTLASTSLAGLGLFCLGITLIVAVTFMPGGIVAVLDRLTPRRPAPLAQPRRVLP
jgi:ABC-type branched-subunit amino acid transport system permease subunit